MSDKLDTLEIPVEEAIDKAVDGAQNIHPNQKLWLRAQMFAFITVAYHLGYEDGAEETSKEMGSTPEPEVE